MKCSNCNTRVNKKFNLCPNCGEKVIVKERKNDSKIKYLIIAVILLVIMGCFLFLINKGYSVNEIRKSVVKINVYDKSGEVIQTGSGFIVFDKNILVTNAHVITGGVNADAVTETDEKIYINGAIYYNQDEDIAILKLNKQNSLKPLKTKVNYKVGDKVIAIGSPLGIKNSVSDGIISNILDDEIIQHTAPISHGSSGGTLFNSKGYVIAMNTASYTNGQNINLSIPIEKIEHAYKEAKNNKVKSIKKIQLNDDEIIQSVLLNNNSGKQIVELIKKETNNNLAIRNNINDLEGIPVLKTIYENKGLFSHVLVIWGKDDVEESEDASERTLIKESTIPEIIILKLNEMNEEYKNGITQIFKERANEVYQINSECFWYCQSSKYQNSFLNPTIGFYNDYAYMIVSTKDDVTKQIEKQIKLLP